MSGLETAIRNALERADRTNAEVRARIYQSARQALEAGLRKQDVTDPGIVATQRHRLEETIRAVEHEERLKLGIVMADPAADLDYDALDDFDTVEPDPRDGVSRAGADEGFGAPRASADEGFGGLRAERLADNHAAGAPVQAPDAGMGRASSRISGAPSRRAGGTGPGGHRRRSRRGLFARLFVWLILLAFLAMGGWWAYTSGLFLTDAERDTSVANPPAAVSEDDLPAPGEDGGPSGDTANSFSKDWIEIFKPGDMERVKPGSQASATATSTGDGPVVRLTSRSPDADGQVRIVLPADRLSLSKGQQATLALSLRSPSDQSVELIVDCDFGTRATCERHRFTVSSQRSDALIQLVPGGAGTPEGGEPALVLNSDVDGKGQGIDLLAVRILPVP